MSRSFAGLSGTYNVRANELALQKNQKSIRVLVYFLDDSQHVFELERRAKGHQLLDLVFRHLELIERDYFGLQYQEAHALRWLDANKRVRRQLRAPFLLHFRVKFFVTEPSRLLEEYTRYHFFLQLRKDILSGKLVATEESFALLASFVAQSELGDFSSDDHVTGYLSDLKLIPHQTKEFEDKVKDLHRLLVGETPADAELHFLEEVCALQQYGLEVHAAKDQQGQHIQIGVSATGIRVLSPQTTISHFSWAKIVKISFKRRHFFVQLRREGTERFDNLLGFDLISYSACKSLWKCCVEQHTFFRLQTPKPHTKKFFFFFSLGSKFRYSGKTEFQTLEENKKRLTRTERTFVRTRSSRFTRQTVPIPHIAQLMNGGGDKSANSQRVQSTPESPSPRPAWQLADAFSPPLKHALPFIDNTNEKRLSSLSDSDSSPLHAILVQMRPDQDGRFGFNVKGGHDQQCPVLVSRVAPNTPAESARLREGDQVLAINGQDVNGLSHERIVQLIRSTSAELRLQLRPNVYSRDVTEEPPFQYIPADQSPNGLSGDEPLQESMLLLREGLDSGALVLQFEQLNRKKNGESMSCARLQDNLYKNRYRDISPYDSTRVVLADALSGDYINASFVNMAVRGVVLRYIATQGPLKETSDDFWQMVWEQRSPLVVMVTPLEEKGRKKCHKYWSDHEMTISGQFRVKTESETHLSAFVERVFRLSTLDGQDERECRQLQYLAWPDHGVPDRDHDFLELIFKVRETRAQYPFAPFIVHCSAGIGRTGVLILMETGLELVEANDCVFPLDLVQTMRAQRAMLIQTSSQFRFVCEALHRAFADKLVEPKTVDVMTS